MIEQLKRFLFGTKDVEYLVVDCPKMPSAIGMTVVGKPNPKSSFVIRKEKEFRTIIPQSISDIEKGFIVETKYLTITFVEKSII
jgi:hypothetical protein